MNSYRKVTVAAAAVLLASAAGCNNDRLTAVNKNPNAPEQVGTGLLFASGVTGAVNRTRSDIELTFFSMWPQHLAEFQYPEASFYELRPTDADGYWLNFYTGPVQDFEQARRQAIAANRPNEIGPILTMRAYTYWFMTGMWGDIPFTEASKADEGMITPVYDRQEVIYDSLLTNLAAANQMMGATAAGNFGAQDPLYGGDVAHWKKFANSLRARLGLDLIKADPTQARAEVTAAIAAGGFASNADNAELHWPGDGVNDNPWNANQLEGSGSRDDVRFAKTFIDTLNALNDPRRAIYARPIPAGGYAGMPHGIEAEDAALYNNAASKLGTQVFEATQPSYLMTYAEFSFIKAEAAHRGWITGSAAQFYNEGIRASMEQWGVAAADIDAYLLQPRVVFNPATGLEQIILQKWIAFFTQGYEAWSEWRRTGLPVLQPAVASRINPPAIPRRVVYPQTEQSFNDANLRTAITNLGTDALTTRIWIDKP
jgi:SusD/RagB-like outer membrane lipoprotein